MNRVKYRKIRKFLKKFSKYVILVCTLLVFIYYIIPEKRLNASQESHTQRPPDNKNYYFSDYKEDLKQGNYHRVLKALNETSEKPPEFLRLLMDTLKVHFLFTYLPSHSTNKKNYDALLSLAEDSPYYLSCQIITECYLYLFQITSTDDVVMLFPCQEFSSLKNPLKIGKLRIPEGEQWIYLDDKAGEETIIIIASRWQQLKLEHLFELYKENIQMDNGQSAADDLLSFLNDQAKYADMFPGLVYTEYQFLNTEVAQSTEEEE